MKKATIQRWSEERGKVVLHEMLAHPVRPCKILSKRLRRLLGKINCEYQYASGHDWSLPTQEPPAYYPVEDWMNEDEKAMCRHLSKKARLVRQISDDEVEARYNRVHYYADRPFEGPGFADDSACYGQEVEAECRSLLDLLKVDCLAK